MSLSALNWKRGMLRLWAVVAVLWVGVAFYSNDTVQRVRDVHDPYAPFSSPVAPRDCPSSEHLAQHLGWISGA